MGGIGDGGEVLKRIFDFLIALLALILLALPLLVLAWLIRRKLGGPVLGAFAYGPAPTEPHHGDLFWYGVHGVETLYTIMGTGCERVTRAHARDYDEVVGTWRDAEDGELSRNPIEQGSVDATVAVHCIVEPAAAFWFGAAEAIKRNLSPGNARYGDL